MVDPVIAGDGYTYERAAMEAHMSRTAQPELPLSPMSGVMLPSRALVPNKLAHDVIKHVHRGLRAVEHACGAEL